MKQWIKKYKHFLMKAVNLCLIVGICIGYHGIALARAEKEAEIEKKNQEAAAAMTEWKDGTFEGVGTGFGGEIKVQVTIADGSITDIKVISAEQEDAAYLDNAKSILTDMVKQQTGDVDIASGATYSSNGIIEAVKNALKEAE